MNDTELQAAMDRSTGQQINSLTDLIGWVGCHIGDNATNEDINTVANAIWKMDHPAWGSDWRTFLSSIDVQALY